jgi:hypothetical protein
MAVKIYNCPECNWSGRKLSRPELKCPECESLLEEDLIATCKGADFERVPGGYDSMKLNQDRHSIAGQDKEAAYLSGTSRTAY